jgi:hypothetical protein
MKALLVLALIAAVLADDTINTMFSEQERTMNVLDQDWNQFSYTLTTEEIALCSGWTPYIEVAITYTYTGIGRTMSVYAATTTPVTSSDSYVGEVTDLSSYVDITPNSILGSGVPGVIYYGIYGECGNTCLNSIDYTTYTRLVQGIYYVYNPTDSTYGIYPWLHDGAWTCTFDVSVDEYQYFRLNVTNGGSTPFIVYLVNPLNTVLLLGKKDAVPTDSDNDWVKTSTSGSITLENGIWYIGVLGTENTAGAIEYHLMFGDGVANLIPSLALLLAALFFLL